METMIKAINKFFYYSQNYPVVRIEYPSISGGTKYDYLPDFFKAFPDHIKEHLRGKWVNATEKVDSYGYVNKFYAELDSTYRRMMLEYICNNYHDEGRI